MGLRHELRISAISLFLRCAICYKMRSGPAGRV
jgi:hypothetical protein